MTRYPIQLVSACILVMLLSCFVFILLSGSAKCSGATEALQRVRDLPQHRLARSAHDFTLQTLPLLGFRQCGKLPNTGAETRRPESSSRCPDCQ